MGVIGQRYWDRLPKIEQSHQSGHVPAKDMCLTDHLDTFKKCSNVVIGKATETRAKQPNHQFVMFLSRRYHEEPWRILKHGRQLFIEIFCQRNQFMYACHCYLCIQSFLLFIPCCILRAVLTVDCIGQNMCVDRCMSSLPYHGLEVPGPYYTSMLQRATTTILHFQEVLSARAASSSLISVTRHHHIMHQDLMIMSTS